MHGTKKQSWYKLDYSAESYPLLATASTDSLYRISADLDRDVIVTLLRKAIAEIMPRFPSFKVRMSRGFFWYYFEENKKDPPVFADDGTVLRKISPRKNRDYLFRILFHKKRVSMEMYHAVTDGLGAAEFFKALLLRYLLLCGLPVDGENKIISLSTPVSAEETEDSFPRYMKKTKIKDLSVKHLSGGNSFRMKGKFFRSEGYGVTEGRAAADKVLLLAKKQGASLTEYLAASYLYAIYTAKAGGGARERSINAFIPINLRKLFPSRTLRNFVSFGRVGVPAGENTLTFEDFLAAVKSDMKKILDKDLLQNNVTVTVKGLNLVIYRYLPLPLKYFFFKLVKTISFRTRQSGIVSNLGVLELPENMRPYVKNMSFMLNVSRNSPVNLAICSLWNTLTMTFSRAIRDTDVEKTFFRRLAEEGLDITINSNVWEGADVL